MRVLVILLIAFLAAGCTTGSVKVSGSYTLQAIAAEDK
jgi:hypothetical protein